MHLVDDDHDHCAEDYCVVDDMRAENKQLTAWLDHALRCEQRSCPLCTKARLFLDEGW